MKRKRDSIEKLPNQFANKKSKPLYEEEILAGMIIDMITDLLVLIESNDLAKIKLTHKSYPKFDFRSNLDSKTLMHYAVQHNGDIETLEYLVGTKKFPIEYLDEWGSSVLQLAIQNNNINAVKCLTRAGAISYERVPVLIIAVKSDNLGMVKYFLGVGEKIDNRDEEGYTALHHAARYGYKESVEFLLNSGANENALTNTLDTPLLLASLNGHLEVIKLLHNAGSSLQPSNISGITPLHHAASRGYKEIVEFLLDNNVAVDSKDNISISAFDKAILFEQIKVAKLLIKGGAEINFLQDMNKIIPHSLMLNKQFVNVILQAEIADSLYQGDVITLKKLIEQNSNNHNENGNNNDNEKEFEIVASRFINKLKKYGTDNKKLHIYCNDFKVLYEKILPSELFNKVLEKLNDLDQQIYNCEMTILNMVIGISPCSLENLLFSENIYAVDIEKYPLTVAFYKLDQNCKQMVSQYQDQKMLSSEERTMLTSFARKYVSNIFTDLLLHDKLPKLRGDILDKHPYIFDKNIETNLLYTLHEFAKKSFVQEDIRDSALSIKRNSSSHHSMFKELRATQNLIKIDLLQDIIIDELLIKVDCLGEVCDELMNLECLGEVCDV